ncbi:MAG TPA: PA14 domain-containing protein [Desulfatirhabdiaceae bacterium]|nr:PA14 domain-containing protein [Desulfatirhabdiaceae bacterium]
MIQIQPVKPQPLIDRLTPGLAVRYIEKKFRHINEMPAEINAYAVGKPILMLNHRFNGEEPVFDSGLSREVGLWITGWIHFPKTGQYDLMANSNDGIRVWIGENQVIDDPEVHSDRFSPQASLTVTEAGYYPLKILYFQRKGTACLQMNWKGPGETQFSVIPNTAYSHLQPSGTK